MSSWSALSIIKSSKSPSATTRRTSLYHSGLIIAKNVTNMARHEPEDGGASVFVAGSALTSLLSAAFAIAAAVAGSEDSDVVLSLLLASEIGSCSTTVSCRAMSVGRLAVSVVVGTVVRGGTGTGVASAVDSVVTLRAVALLSCSLAIMSGATLSLFVGVLLWFFLASAWRRTMERWYLYQSSERCFLTQLSSDISQSPPGSSVSATSESPANSNASIVD